jgi:hypothetical protein
MICNEADSQSLQSSLLLLRRLNYYCTIPSCSRSNCNSTVTTRFKARQRLKGADLRLMPLQQRRLAYNRHRSSKLPHARDRIKSATTTSKL